MNPVALQSFGFGDQLVRVVDREDGAWFVGKDVCAALELANHRQALSRLEDDERDGVHTMDAIGRAQETTIISESGVYSLIFTSRKAVAVQFRKWVTGEVLPALRRTGRYEIGANDDEEDGEEIVPLASSPSDLSFVERLKYEPPNIQIAFVREMRMAKGRPGAATAMRLLGWDDGETMGAIEVAVASFPDAAQIYDWVRERTEASPGRMSSTSGYADFVAWSAAAGRPQLSHATFGRGLGKLGFSNVKGADGRRSYRGLRLRE